MHLIRLVIKAYKKFSNFQLAQFYCTFYW